MVISVEKLYKFILMNLDFKFSILFFYFLLMNHKTRYFSGSFLLSNYESIKLILSFKISSKFKPIPRLVP